MPEQKATTCYGAVDTGEIRQQCTNNPSRLNAVVEAAPPYGAIIKLNIQEASMPKITHKARTSGKTTTRFTLGRYHQSQFHTICQNLSSDQVESLLPAIPGAIAKFSHWEVLS